VGASRSSSKAIARIKTHHPTRRSRLEAGLATLPIKGREKKSVEPFERGLFLCATGLRPT
jgi:hypothetical protein